MNAQVVLALLGVGEAAVGGRLLLRRVLCHSFMFRLAVRGWWPGPLALPRHNPHLKSKLKAINR